MKIFGRYVISVLMLALASCVSYEPEEAAYIPDGVSELNASVAFPAFTPALETRAGGMAGDAIKSINSLWLVIYEKSGDDKWTLEKGGVVRITPENNGLTTGVDEKTRPDGLPQAETDTGYANFRFRHKNGVYKIYAVANCDLSAVNPDDISTPDDLKNLPVNWDENDIAGNAEMFGSLSNDASQFASADETVTIAPHRTLHAWIRRAASKITVAYDGSNLEKGVSIFIKSLRIKHIPRTCLLGASNTVESEGNLIETGQEVVYSTSTNFDESYPALVRNDLPYYPRTLTVVEGVPTWIKDPESHSETNPNSIFFYENMQGSGPDKRQFDKNKDGVLDDLFKYKDMPYATYIEVEAYYESSNEEHPGICNITYRFMLGQDIISDYNARRNSHYKLTLHFNGFADDPDWRIDYVSRLWVTKPKAVNYQGKYFAPDGKTSNQGSTFLADNSIVVTSFMYENDSWSDRKPMKYKIEYREGGDTVEFTETRPDWLDDFTTTDEGNGVFRLKINYKNPYDNIILDTLLSRNDSNEDYDLSTKGGKESRTTANCYMVNAKGSYKFPLVYGNAITDGSPNADSYTYKGGLPATNLLKTFKNYKDKSIGSEYILDDIYGNMDNVPEGISASLLWQDESNLVTNIAYDGSAFDHGGITFDVGENIKEGNAVIALKDDKSTIMWSWHIWVTAIDSLKNVTITNNNNQNFDILPVNLGWCTGGTPVRHYRRHECDVRFTQIIDDGEVPQYGVSQVVTIVQEPHIALPQGNNPYFQWGRKDPFFAGGDKDATFKPWYDAENKLKNTSADSVKLMYADNVARVSTYNAIASLIKNPDKWQNCPHEATGSTTIPYRPADSTYFNLWDNSIWDDNDYVVKTVYDPCPPGYHVSSLYTFNGFVDSGGSISGDMSEYMYAATDDNMLQVKEYKNNIFEFYTDTTKLISLGFPQNGYRDWDYKAHLVTANTVGQIWHAQAAIWGWVGNKYTAYHFEYSRNNRIWPWNMFHATDGFAVRPVKDE